MRRHGLDDEQVMEQAAMTPLCGAHSRSYAIHAVLALSLGTAARIGDI